MKISDTLSDGEIGKFIELRWRYSTGIEGFYDDHAALSRVLGLDDWIRNEVQ